MANEVVYKSDEELMTAFEQFKEKLDVFCGYITEPEFRYTQNGKCVCTFAIPLKKNKNDEPLFLNCEAWNSVSERIEILRLKKGDKVLVFGDLKEVEYTDKENNKKKKIIFSLKGVI